MNNAIKRVIKQDRDNDLKHSEEFVVMFCGYLAADLPELHSLHPGKILASWNRFKETMGKNPDGSMKP